MNRRGFLGTAAGALAGGVSLWPGSENETVLSRLNGNARDKVVQRYGALRQAGHEVTSLGKWLRAVSPTWQWDPPHLLKIQDALDHVTSGDIRFLILQVPVRHGKTELATVRYPVYRIEKDPTTRVIMGAYSDTLARKFSRKARRIARERGLRLSDERDAAEEWETTAGGGVRAVGRGSGVTGHGGNLIVIDDPIKSRQEANSIAFRDAVWDWLTNDIRTRLEPGGAEVMTMSRWHEDDPVGRILASDDAASWDVVTLPALAEPNDPLGREEGEALWPERYDEEELEKIRLSIGDYAFSALYQQQPTSKAGEMFDPAWFEIVDRVPEIRYGTKMRKGNVTRIRWWDRGATEGGGDPTAGALAARVDAEDPEDGPTFYIEDIEAFQHSAGKRNNIIRQKADADRRKYSHNPPKIWGEQEPGAAGKDEAAAFVRRLHGHAAYTEPTTGDKETAAEPFAAAAENGDIKLVRGPWVREFLEQARTFPRGKHDDMLEAAFRAYNKLAGVTPVRLDSDKWQRARVHA